MTRIFVMLGCLLSFFSLNSPTQATTIRLEIPTCLTVFGDVWGEGIGGVGKREIDGATIKSVADFTRMTQKYDSGVKVIKGGDFTGWDFRKTSLHSVCFEESKLLDANMAGVHGIGVGFVKTDLSGANMRDAIMKRVMFRNAELKNVSAQGANFTEGHFDGGWFEGSVEGWNIDGADLTGFTFDCGITVPDGCPVYQGGAKMSAKGTDFSRASLHSFGLHDVELSEAMIDQTIIGPSQLPYLAKAEFRGAIILRGGESDVRLTAEEAQKLVIGNAVQTAAEDRPSFDCAKAASKVELEICGEYASDLRVADRAIAALYQRAGANDAGVKTGQRAWLKQRNVCGATEYPVDCIRESYSGRKGQLLALLGENDWLTRGESALFIDDVLPLPAAMVGSDLFARITPVLVGASMTEILIERGEDGLYAIKGSAVGGNAHLCSINASPLYLDRETGWYVPVSEGAAMPIFRILDGRLEIFAGGEPDYEKYPEASNFMGCGARARFPQTIRINVSDAVIQSYRKSLSEEM